MAGVLQVRLDPPHIPSLSKDEGGGGIQEDGRWWGEVEVVGAKRRDPITYLTCLENARDPPNPLCETILFVELQASCFMYLELILPIQIFLELVRSHWRGMNSNEL